jgi:DNA-binding response OmpR family regulator
MSNGAKHILFVDDEGEVRFTASRYFKQHGYKVSTAENAEEALRVADGVTLHAIILDVNLGGENGLELMTFLRHNHPTVPIILYTGIVHDDETVKKLLVQGADRYLIKGASFDELFKAVQEVAEVKGK